MDKNFIVAILLATLVIIAYSSPFYQKRFGNELPPSQLTNETQTTTDSPNAEKTVSSRNPTPLPLPTIKPAVTENTEVTTALPTDAAQNASQINAPDSEEKLVLENDDIVVTVSTVGGVIRSAVLKNFNGISDDVPLQLVKEGESWYNGFIQDEETVISFGDIIFTNASASSNTIVLEAELTGNRKVVREFSLEDSGYLINARTLLPGDWSNPILHFSWLGPLNITESPVKKLNIWPFSMMSRDNSILYTKLAFMGQGERTTVDIKGKEKVNRIFSKEGAQKIDAKKAGEMSDSFYGEQLDWYAVRNLYFMSAAIPKEGNRWSAQSRATYDGVEKWSDFTISKRVSDGDTDLEIYAGPISYSLLKGYERNLTEVMEFSFKFVRPLSIAFLWLFKMFHTFIPNWGLVVVVFAIFIKLVLYPFSHKSFESMRKMSELQPQIQALKKKYPNNAPAMQKAQMELYKKEGVNPMGGCLPMLFQMPVFFALYPVVGRAFELRQAMFIPLWINDLSRPDPYYILPVAMGVSMFFQTKLTSSSDPNQKMMLYMMPVMMVFLFANFSAGLTLYWFLFNIMSYLQQKIHRHKTITT